MLKQLNLNTGELKHTINKDCGERGRRWFQDLEQRIEAARGHEAPRRRVARVSRTRD
jgi:hypothetical protein